MRAAASLHRHHTGRQLRREFDHAVPMHPTAQDHTSGRVQTGDTASVLAEVDTQNRDLHRSAPLSSSCPGQRSRAGEGAGHSINWLRRRRFRSARSRRNPRHEGSYASLVGAAIANGRRHGHRPRQLVTTFGPLTLSVPRARLANNDAGEREWKSELLPAYRRLSRRAELVIAEVYLAGVNTRPGAARAARPCSPAQSARPRSAAPGAGHARRGRPGSSAIWPMTTSCA
jgi:hypothetical protein